MPENLLKVSDLKETYDDAMEMEEMIKRYKEHQEGKVEYQNQQYNVHLENTSRLLTISYVEILVIVITGVYQFFTVRKFLIDKQYLWLSIWPFATHIFSNLFLQFLLWHITSIFTESIIFIVGTICCLPLSSIIDRKHFQKLHLHQWNSVFENIY